jgi:hypothetical protein
MTMAHNPSRKLQSDTPLDQVDQHPLYIAASACHQACLGLPLAQSRPGDLHPRQQRRLLGGNAGLPLLRESAASTSHAPTKRRGIPRGHSARACCTFPERFFSASRAYLCWGCADCWARDRYLGHVVPSHWMAHARRRHVPQRMLLASGLRSCSTPLPHPCLAPHVRSIGQSHGRHDLGAAHGTS